MTDIAQPASVYDLAHEDQVESLATFAVLIAFMAYQFYRYTYTHDIGLVALTVLDLIVLGLAWHEYELVKRTRRFAQAGERR